LHDCDYRLTAARWCWPGLPDCGCKVWKPRRGEFSSASRFSDRRRVSRSWIRGRRNAQGSQRIGSNDQPFSQTFAEQIRTASSLSELVSTIRGRQSFRQSYVPNPTS